jgi:putative spermidine/putrescine transport system permease protein
VPFFSFAVAFLLWPSATLIVGSFQDARGSFTFQNVASLTQPIIVEAYWLSIRISLVTAIGGAVFGFLLAYAVTLGGLPTFVRSGLLSFSGVASNFAGVPLALAFMATLGRTGLATVLLRTLLGVNIYDQGFNLYGFWGLSLTYMYFQFPLMVLIMAPALDGLKREWREASENLGASSTQYWRYVALPILTPSLLGTMLLLFGNAFGAQATAFALTGGTLNLTTILIGQQITGDVLHNPNLGYALALGMVVVMAASIALYSLLQRWSERWRRA